MSIRAHELTSDPRWTADVIIVGSGASGAVWAERLTAAGKDVLLLEEGGHYTKEDFTQREDEMYRLLFRNGANQVTADERINVLQGRCVGGSTVVNMADVERIPPEILEYWRKLTGIAEFREDVFRPYFERCEEVIGANTIPVEQLNRNNSLLKEGTEKLGHRGAPMRHNRVNCIGSGYCLIGCAYDAKQSTAITFVPKAVSHGARLVSGAQVESLLVSGDTVTGVVGFRTDPRTGRKAGRFEARAKTVVLAAGAIHTPLILLRSGIDDGPVGMNLSLQPQLPVMAVYKEEVRSFRGIPQSYYHDQFEIHSPDAGLGGFRLEGISGQPAMSSSSLAVFGHAQKELMMQYAHTGAALVLVPDQPGGSVKLGKGPNRAIIDYDMQDGWKKTALQGMRTAAEVFFAAGALQVLLPTNPVIQLKPGDRFDDSRIDFEPGRVATISAHPQGTCRIGKDPKTSVVDPQGRHHRFQNLYVIDASLFPTTASTHTMIPIMGMADWLADAFLSA